MKQAKFLRSLMAVVLLFCISNASSKNKSNTGTVISVDTMPPYNGTIFIVPGIIVPSDSSVFQGLSYEGKGMRIIFSRANNKWEHKEVYLFEANFLNGRNKIEIEVDTVGFVNVNRATAFVKKYSIIIGQLPAALRSGLYTITIRRGMYPFGGGSHNLLIYTDYGEKNYKSQGVIEEALIHEATHISLDSLYSHTEAWLDAQRADSTFISTYAENHPDREDIAESFLLFMAIRYRTDRIPESTVRTIKKTIPNRIRFFDQQSFDMAPIE